MKIEFAAPLQDYDSSIMWTSVVYIPKHRIEELGPEKNPRVKVTFNNTKEAHISVKSSGDIRYLVVNSEIRKALKLSVGESVNVLIEEEKSEYGMPMPEEFALMLAEDEIGNKLFHELTPGKQRSLIYMVSKVKNVDAKIRKALAIVEHLNEAQGELEFRALNEKMKEVNQRFKNLP
ncbi:MAG: YdeI/OmpD-associated family protein [Salibacteraceae bacterium]